MAIPVNVAKIKAFIFKYKKLIVLSVIGSLIFALIVSIGLATYNVFRRRDTNREAAKSADVVKKSQVNPVISTATVIELHADMRAGKYATAKERADLILLQEDLTAADKTAAYSTLASACLKLADFSCLDRVFAYMKESKQVDNYTIVDAARLAKSKGQTDKAKEYYKLAFDDIEAKGGKAYFDKANEGLEVALDYNEIAEGAK